MTTIGPGRAAPALAVAALLALAGCDGGGGAADDVNGGDAANAAGTATAPGAATATAAGGETAAIPETDDPALDYARLFMPASQVTDQGVALFRQTFDASFASVPENVALERARPGTQQAAREAGAAAMEAVFRRELPGIQGRIADAVRGRATADQFREIGRFMRTDTARAMQRGASQSIAGPAMDRAGDGGPALRAGDLARAGAASVGALTTEQATELQRFAATPAGQALNEIGPVAASLVMRETNALAQRAEPEVRAAIAKVVQERTRP
ncbi:hypothetical protein GGR88_002703 [Sphingomonas jejuensis]|uniref:DUF2059 domain-containing protein n=1 Tax=Sphingomonas jejuensis TaxID=904715 RepID=A0ABX0XP82_9SPHN|nr:hypothetical protein [Sphingomonas jejuensis]NJC35189.1 hypothetical protein [Sphingomonas jejuensis]